MMEWFKDGLAHKASTFWGAAALIVGTALIGAAFLAPDSYEQVKDAVLTFGELLMAGGVAGVVYRKKPEQG